VERWKRVRRQPLLAEHTGNFKIIFEGRMPAALRKMGLADGGFFKDSPPPLDLRQELLSSARTQCRLLKDEQLIQMAVEQPQVFNLFELLPE